MQRRWVMLKKLICFAFLFLMVIDLSIAQGDSDVVDTHTRLNRIYQKLDIDDQPAQAEGCGRSDEMRPRSSLNMPNWLGILLVIVILAVMFVPLITILRKSIKNRSAGEEIGIEQDVIVTGREPWRVNFDQCHMLASQGRLAEAFATLHKLALLRLNRRNQLELNPSTTNWEYVRQLSAEHHNILAAVTLAAERAVLGKAPPSQEQFAELSHRVQAL